MTGRTDSLGHFEQLLLTAVMTLGEKAYGLAVFQKTSELAGKRVNLGAVYVVLDRLERKGYVSSRTEPGGPERAGRPRRFFKILPAGERALEESFTTSRRLAEDAEGWWSIFKWRPSGH